MTNPVLVEVTRGERVESRHRGAVVVIDARGKKVLAIGDIDAPVYPRSAVKAIQALPLVESGAADAFGFHARELALSQASHGGEPEHVAGVSAMLAAIGLDETALECGAHAPSHGPPPPNSSAAARRRASSTTIAPASTRISWRSPAISAIDHRGYVGARHPVQVAVAEALASLTGASHGTENCGIDGCSIPTYAVPLSSLALGFARLATGIGLERDARRRGATDLSGRRRPSRSTSPAQGASAPM